MVKQTKNILGEEDKEVLLEGAPEGDVLKTKSGIEVGSPLDIRPKSLPLVVKLPESASSAQKEYAKILNGYAYQNPEKWEAKKDVLIKRLESLADKEVVIPEGGLSINKSKVSFVFIKDAKGKEYYASTGDLSVK